MWKNYLQNYIFYKEELTTYHDETWSEKKSIVVLCENLFGIHSTKIIISFQIWYI